MLAFALVTRRVHFVTGILRFALEATKMYGNLEFQIKMVLIVVAGLNAFVFNSIAYQNVGKCENVPVVPLPARAAGGATAPSWAGIGYFRKIFATSKGWTG